MNLESLIALLSTVASVGAAYGSLRTRVSRVERDLKDVAKDVKEINAHLKNGLGH